jgi:hypothetical protein
MIGVLRAPRATLTDAAADPRWLGVALLIVTISAICSVGFLMTGVGRLAGLDQQVRQLESFGATIDDETYATMRSWVPYRPAISGAIIVIGWPLMWAGLAAFVKAIGNRFGRREIAFGQVFSIVVHASTVFALQSVVAAPINYVRESLGGATSLSTILPAFGESTFPARLLGALDIFMLWWVALMAMGLGILYEARALPIARWLIGAYGAAAVLLALTQALRGGI